MSNYQRKGVDSKRTRNKKSKAHKGKESKPTKPQEYQRNELGHFIKGNDIARVYSKEDIIDEFISLAKRASEGEFFTLEEVMQAAKFSVKKFQELVAEHPEAEELKQEIVNNINAHVARNAMENKLNPAMSIFALKQRGWTDRQVVEQEIKEQPLFQLRTPTSVEEAQVDEQKKLPESDSFEDKKGN